MTPIRSRSGNFDAIRLVAACAVIFGHSFIVGSGAKRLDGLAQLGGSLSVCAVEVFFIVSGYLVTQSFELSPSWARFILARSLRIFPALIACILFSAFILGAAFTTLPLNEYFTQTMLGDYIMYNLFLDVSSYPFLPEVIFHSNEYGRIINGSLWSLPFEYACYIIVLAFGVLRRLDGRTVSVLIGVILAIATFDVFDDCARFLTYFVSGMGMYFLRKRTGFSGRFACLAGLTVVIGNFFSFPWPFFPVLGSYFVIYVAIDAPFHAKNATRFGDLSYGIYLYGWPAEQIAVHLFGPSAQWWQIFAMALPIATVIAWFSWHGIERLALRWKDTALETSSQRVAGAVVIFYGATAAVFGLRSSFGVGNIVALSCLLAAVLALVAIFPWVYARLLTAPLRVWPAGPFGEPEDTFDGALELRRFEPRQGASGPLVATSELVRAEVPGRD
jgi:peptidoglycan/LPS O-acetylase OafA/YrhL